MSSRPQAQTSLWEKLKAVGWAVFPWAFLLMSLYFLLTGLHSGQVDLSGRFSHSVAHRATEPGMYWFGEAVWAFYTLIGLFFISMSLGPWWGNLRDARVSKAQVRSAEAGEGPEPPWIRFPGGLETMSDLMGRESMAYFEDVFIPYWVKLSPEAHAAFLRRHPPPDDWRSIMESAEPSE